jgi:uncharacterized Zn-binding protein involved in type VI secretion
MSLDNIRQAIQQHQQGVTGDQFSGSDRAASTPAAVKGVVTNYVDSVKGLTAPLTVIGNDGNPRPPKGPLETTAAVLRRAEQAAGAVAGIMGVAQDIVDVGFANLTAPLAAVFPSLPAATMTSLYVGIPHAHAHPPSLIPPAPVGVPLPSLGPIVLGNCVRVLLGGKPAARVGDIGVAPTCGGLAPFFKVFLSSSNVFIGGKRATRITDVCRVCTKVPKVPVPKAAGKLLSAVGKVADKASKVIGKAGKAAAVLGMAADVVEAADAASEGEAAYAAASALDAAMQAAQMAADMAAEAVDAMMGTDPAAPSQPVGVGAVAVPGAPTVLIGGFPMINIPNPAEALMNFLKRYKPQAPPSEHGVSEAGGGI